MIKQFTYQSIIFTLLFLATIRLQATNYFVNANTGNNANNGRSVATAKKDFSFCNGIPSSLSPGDTVFIMNGTYVSTDNSPLLRLAFIGTASRPIVFTNYPNHQPVFKYSGLPHALIAFNWAMKTAFVVVNGIKLEGNNLANPFEATLTRAKNQTNNCLNNTVGQPTQAEFNVDGFGIYENGTGCAHITISNCEVSNFPGGGIATGGLDYLTIENCKIYNNGWFAIDGNSGISVLKCKNYDNHPASGFAINVRNNIVYNNINYIPWNGVCRFSDGNGIIIDDLQEHGYNGKVLVENNVCYDNGGAGIQYFKSSNGVVRNNTLYRNGKQDGLPGYQGYRSGEFSMYNSTNVQFYNNIVFPIPGKVAVTSGAADPTKVSGNNLIVSTSPGGFTFGSTDILNQDPQFVNATSGDFRLKCTSPALNAGTNLAGLFSPFDIIGARRPLGNRPDIGAYEANCITNQPPTVTLTSPTNNALFTTGTNILISANASDSDGSISKVEFFSGTVKVGERTTAPYSFSWANTAAGTYSITSRATDNQGATTTSAARNITVNIPVITQSPFGGIAAPIPGRIEAENYDNGGKNVAYNDNTIGNIGGSYRSDDVDVQVASSGGHNVGWTSAGEWMKYTVNVTAAGNYDFKLRVASTQSGKSLRVEMKGISIGTFNVPNTDGWQSWETVTINGVALTSGVQEMRIFLITDGYNIDYIDVSATIPVNVAPTITLSSPANNATFTAGTNITISANASDIDGSVSKVEFFRGETKIGEKTSAPYTITWTNAAVGSYMVTAKVTDNRGATTISAPRNITVTSPSVGVVCVEKAIPAATDWIVINDWADQNGGASVTNESSALKVTQRQWGRDHLWVIETGKKVDIVTGKQYTISFDYKDDANVNISSINFGFSTSTSWNGPLLSQPFVTVPAGYSSYNFTKKTFTVTAIATGSFHLAFKLNWGAQVNAPVSDYIKNISICSAVSTLRIAADGYNESEVNLNTVSNAEITAYPNPFVNETSLLIRSEQKLPLLLVITNGLGVVEYESNNHFTNEKIVIGTELTNGVYHIQAYIEGKMITSKLMKL